MPFTTKQSDVFYNEETKEMFVCTVSSVTALACEGADEQTLYGAVPILYKIDKDTNYKSTVYPRDLSTFDTTSASDLFGVTPNCPEGTNFTTITKPLINYNKTKDRYIVTFLGKYVSDSEGIGVSNFVFQNIDTNFYLLDAQIYIPRDKFTNTSYTFENGRLNSDFIVGGNTIRNNNSSYFSNFERSPEYLIPPTLSDNTSFLSGSDSLGFNLMLFHSNTDTDTLTGDKQFPMMYSGGHIGHNPKYTAFDPEHSIRIDFTARCFNVPSMTAFYSTQSVGASASRWVENCDSPTGFGEGFCVYFYENPTIGGYVIPNGTNTTLGYAKADYTLVEKAGTAQSVDGLYIHRKQIGTIVVPDVAISQSTDGKRPRLIDQSRTPLQKDPNFWHPSFAGGLIEKPDTKIDLEQVPTRNIPAPKLYEPYFGSIQFPIEPANSFLGIGFDVRGKFCTTLEGKSGWYKEDIGAYGSKTIPDTLDGYTFTEAPCSVGIRGSSFHDTEVLSCIPLSGIPTAKDVPMHTNCAQANANDAPFVDYRIDLTNKGSMVTIYNKLSTESDYNTIAEFRLNSVSHAGTKYDPWKGFSLTDDNRLKPLNVGLSFTTSDYCSYFELKSFEVIGVKINNPWDQTKVKEQKDETKQVINSLHQSSKMLREKLVKVQTEDDVDVEIEIPAKGRLAREIYERNLDKDITLCDGSVPDVIEHDVSVKLTGLKPEEVTGTVDKIERGEQPPTNTPDIITDTPVIEEGGDTIEAIIPEVPPPPAAVDCKDTQTYDGGPSWPTRKEVALGTVKGLVKLTYEGFSRPDRFQVFLGEPNYDGSGRPTNLVIDTGFVGDSGWVKERLRGGGKSLRDALYEDKGWDEKITDTITRDDVGPMQGTAAFEKTTTEQLAVVLIWAPIEHTQWEFHLHCPKNPVGTVISSETLSDGTVKNILRTQAEMDADVKDLGGAGKAWQPPGVNLKTGGHSLIGKDGKPVSDH